VEVVSTEISSIVGALEDKARMPRLKICKKKSAKPTLYEGKIRFP
jgi:hypothetical protein